MSNAVEDDQYLVMPFYLVCDVSGSMSGKNIEVLNETTGIMRRELLAEPVISDLVLFGLIDFDDQANVRVPLCPPQDMRVPQLTVRGGTSYKAAFETVKDAITHDMAELKRNGYKVYRPAVFFLSDGVPNRHDGWEAAFADLTEYDRSSGVGFKSYPLIVPFGVGEADTQVLDRLRHPRKVSKLYMARSGADVGAAIAEMALLMVKSMVKSGQSTADGTPKHYLPSAAEVSDQIEVFDQYEDGDFV